MVEARNLRKSYGDTCLIQDLTFTLPPAGIVGVIGANGAGKTTLFRMITGEEKPDAGTLTLGETVELGYVDQSRELDPEKTVWETVSDGDDEIRLGSRRVASRAYCSWFNFKGRDQQRTVGTLSGGERNRVHLARLLRGGANLLLLDEPTNDLDVDTLRALEDALVAFAGCVAVISHGPVVPRPHRHPHPRLRGRQPGRLVPGQLPGLRGRPPPPPRLGRRPAPPHQVPPPRAGLTAASEGARCERPVQPGFPFAAAPPQARIVVRVTATAGQARVRTRWRAMAATKQAAPTRSVAVVA